MSSSGTTSPHVPLKHPVSIRDGYITTSSTTLTVHIIKQTLNVPNMIAKASDGTTLFQTTGGRLSGRELQDSTGLPLFNIWRRTLHRKPGWVVGLPGESKANAKTLGINQRSMSRSRKLEIILKGNGMGEDGDVLLEARDQDSEHLVTHLVLGDALVAVFTRQQKDESRRTSPSWQVEVVQGVDLTLIVMIVVALADVFVEEQAVIAPW